MMKTILIGLIVFFSFFAMAQTPEELKVKQSIEALFSSMASKDSVKIKSVMHQSARLQSASFDKNGKSVLKDDHVSDFLKQIASIPLSVNIEERILSFEIKIDGNLATAWTPYQFYVNNKLSHCGVNIFQLFKEENNNWKIIQIADTRRKENCE
ncbi:nuclear transport factor 2 family protein [Pedobacter cryophilus]|uniref:Nuclear transport factor 2 family protein n=1 Tax=Pedobacter cryophilus TaxID=2571271 RepID=A0A4V5NXQ5_9SPHI|nr:nuclear transport factor 2 family protein [Pedobacter cryophilus]TKC00361.1 nuclear transport factor 2 family protein [Pedobacter cryophilus]